ncbi:MAG: hypothetical protein ACXQS8_07455 [Candidatus Helarchaeales archaeon]
MIRESIAGLKNGEEVTMMGIAANAKGSACIVLKSGEPIYIPEISEWTDELLNRKILITGIYYEKKFIPDPVIDEDGAISTGAFGNQHVLERVKEIKQA